MKMEQLDIVDLEDKPTGKVAGIDVVHKQAIPHRVSAVFVFDEEGNLLQQVHERYKQLDHTVGGHVSAGEDYRSAAVREMKEEIGLDTPLTEVALSVLSDERFQNFHFIHLFGIYEAQAPANWQFKPNDEVKELLPMKLAAIIDEMNANPGKFTRGFINTMQAYLEAKELPYKIDKKVLLKERKGA